jgi:hypothetical protein
MFSDGILTIERGDILSVPRYGFAQVMDVELERIRVHPPYGPEYGWFSRSQVIAWRDKTWKDWDEAGVKPVDIARAMFPENWT